MKPLHDEHVIPEEHRHGLEGRRFREWRETHPHGTWREFQHDRRMNPTLGEMMQREPLTPEQEQRAFLRDHDTGDLDERERQLLSIGIAPAMTPRRLLGRLGHMIGLAMMALGFALWGVSALAALLVGITGLALFITLLVAPSVVTGGRS